VTVASMTRPRLNSLQYILMLMAVYASWAQDKSDCSRDPSVCESVENSFCHKFSRMCICQNGLSSFPMCSITNRRASMNNFQNQRDYCRQNPECCNVRCSRYEMCHGGQCECMYGKSRGRCRRCMQPCRRSERCVRSRRSGKYYCKRKRPPKINCTNICGEGSKCKRVRGVVHCTACGPGKRLDDGICATAYTWSPWSLWSGCSITCGKGGKRTRRRRCNVPEKCPGETREQTDCVEKLKICYGKWSAWGPYITACSSNCGGGVQNRYRTCQGGEYCPGLPFSQRKCNTMPCGGGGD